MQCGQSTAIDLPKKSLICEDETGQVWLSYNDPRYLAKLHGIKGCVEAMMEIENALVNYTKTATMA